MEHVCSISYKGQLLIFSVCGCFQDEVMKDIAVGCSSLLYLNLSHCNVSDASLRYLSRYLRFPSSSLSLYLSLSFPLLLRYLKELFIINYMIISHIMIFYRNISPVFALCILLLPLCLKQLVSGILILTKVT